MPYFWRIPDGCNRKKTQSSGHKRHIQHMVVDVSYDGTPEMPKVFTTMALSCDMRIQVFVTVIHEQIYKCDVNSKNKIIVM